MPGTQLSRRHFSIRARQGQKRLQQGGQKMASTCCSDFINPKMMPIKVTFFFFMGATQCIAPYSTLLMKSLGLTVEETAIIFTIGPLIPIVAPFLAGIMTDKIGNFRTFLVITVALSGILSLVHVLIPPARTEVKLHDDNEDVQFNLHCEGETFRITFAEPSDCETPNKPLTVDYINATRCGYVCSPPAIQIDDKVDNEEKRTSKLSILNYHNDSFSFTCEIEVTDAQKCFLDDLRPNATIINTKEFALRNVLLDFPKMKKSDKLKTFLINDYMMTPSDANTFDCKTGNLRTNVEIRKLSVSVSTRGESPMGTVDYVPCEFHCEGVLQVNTTCNNTSQVEVHDVSLTFWLFVVSKTVEAFMIGLTYTMFEAGVMAILKEHDYDYGLQRIYGSIGGMIFAPLTGYLIDYFGEENHYSDYYVCYYMYCIMKFLCALLLTKMDLTFRDPSRSICGNIAEIFSSVESVLLITIVFVSGMCYGFIEHFLPWHIRDLGAENWIIGLMTTVASVAALPFLAMSGFLCKKFGHIQCISFGIVCYAIRCFGYSLLKNPYWCFPFEILEGVTTGLLVAAAIIYGAKLSHQRNLGTLQGMLATSHYGFGKSAGSLAGGFTMARLGAPTAFQIFGGGAFVIAFIYYLFFKLLIQPKQEQLNRIRREVSAMPVEVVPKKRMDEAIPSYGGRRGQAASNYPLTSTPIKNSQLPQQHV